MLCFWEHLEQGLRVPVSHRKEGRDLFWQQQDPHPPSVLCSPQPDVRGEPDKGEQQSPPEQPAGECWGREKFHTWSLGTGSVGH